MKKTSLIILSLIFSLSTVFLLVGCDQENADSTSKSSQPTEQSVSNEESLSSGSGSGASDSENSVFESEISFKTLTVSRLSVEGTVSNATEQFSFADEIIVTGNSDFVVSLDQYGFQTSLTKNVPLSPGNNVFYILETVNGTVKNVYTVTIRRKPVYQVSFYTNNQIDIPSQYVEEGSFATEPTETVTREGYEFTSWIFDFSSPIMSNKIIFAQWDLIHYEINYDYGGGELISAENPDEYNIESEFTLNDPFKEYYEFVGWYDGNVKITSLKGCYGNKTLVAKWKSVYTVSDGAITGLTDFGKQNYSTLIIPSEIDGYKINAIGDGAFAGCGNLINVTIPASITSVGSQAFINCSNLETVTFESGSNPKNVNADTFKYCSKLKFNQKNNVKYLGNSREPYLVFVEALPIWEDFSYIANAFGKGTEFSAVEGIFTITNGKAYTSAGRTVKEGTKAGTIFTGSVQVTKNGSATDKCITFTVPEAYTTIELYINGASAGIDGEFYVSVNGVPTSYPCVNSNVTAVTVSVSAGAQVAIYGGSVVSTNVWGILLK
ncbi:MAG: leucine-rich repeat protein [Christensenellaceae bacterium]